MSTGIDEELSKFGVDITHHFGGGVYVKETLIPEGTRLQQHAHLHDHLSFLSSGAVILWVDGQERLVEAPKMLTIEAHKVHAVQALQDSRWLCIWATDEIDPEQVAEQVIER